MRSHDSYYVPNTKEEARTCNRRKNVRCNRAEMTVSLVIMCNIGSQEFALNNREDHVFAFFFLAQDPHTPPPAMGGDDGLVLSAKPSPRSRVTDSRFCDFLGYRRRHGPVR